MRNFREILELLRVGWAKDSIFVYQMGKVGSSTIEKTLRKSVHIHNFFDNDPCWINPRLSFPGYKYWLLYRPFLFFRRQVFKSRAEKKIITLVRNPLDRNVSMYFQNLHAFLVQAYTGFPIGRDKHVMPLARDGGVRVLVDIYNRLFPKDYPLNWFDNELKRLSGIDVFDYPFDKDLGYSIIAKGSYKILVLTAEKLRENTSVIQEFSGVDSLIFGDVNTGAKKWYSQSYSDFKDAFVPPRDELDLYLNSQFVSHFYDVGRLKKEYEAIR
jgi:hypothetical protein